MTFIRAILTVLVLATCLGCAGPRTDNSDALGNDNLFAKAIGYWLRYDTAATDADRSAVLLEAALSFTPDQLADIEPTQLAIAIATRYMADQGQVSNSALLDVAARVAQLFLNQSSMASEPAVETPVDPATAPTS